MMMRSPLFILKARIAIVLAIGLVALSKLESEFEPIA